MIGNQGVRLKKFEEVVCDCIINNSDVIPKYVPLPNVPSLERLLLIEKGVEQSISSSSSSSPSSPSSPPPSSQTFHGSSNKIFNKDENEDETKNDVEDIPPPSFPFDILPSAACVRIPSHNIYGPSYDKYNLGKLSGIRALRKEWQLSSMIQCLLAMLPSHVLGPLSSSSSSQSSSFLDQQSNKDRIKIVDFAGGTGHLALPLALMLPKCDIILVDLKATSLELVHEKAKDLLLTTKENTANERNDLFLSPRYTNTESVKVHSTSNSASVATATSISTTLTTSTITQKNEGSPLIMTKKTKEKKKKSRIKPKGASRDIDVTSHTNTIQQSQHIPNLYTYHGSITKYAQDHDFDIGLSLHCCGEGTDLVLRACGKAKANFIVCPCCVGKLSSQKRNPYVYHATSSNKATVSYPQSSIFRQLIPDSMKFDALAKAADYSDFQDMRTSRNANRRTAKALLETDRIFMCKEIFGYDDVVLSRMSPWEASPKNDILIGWFKNKKKKIMIPYDHLSGSDDNSIRPDQECNADIEVSMNQLVFLHRDGNDPRKVENQHESFDDDVPNTDWSREEMQKYRSILEDFIASDENLKRFPTRMGSRLRKLVHYHAEKMNLRHWPEGKKVSEKIVVIAKKKQH